VCVCVCASHLMSLAALTQALMSLTLAALSLHTPSIDPKPDVCGSGWWVGVWVVRRVGVGVGVGVHLIRALRS
jgi:hypothetical protein